MICGQHFEDYEKLHHYSLRYTFDGVNALIFITDGDDAKYSLLGTASGSERFGLELSGWAPRGGARRGGAADLNLSITQITESDTRQNGATLYMYFEYNDLRLVMVHGMKRNQFIGVTAGLRPCNCV